MQAIMLVHWSIDNLKLREGMWALSLWMVVLTMVNNCEETPPRIQMCDELFVFFFLWNMHLQKLHLIVSIFHIQEDEKK